MSQAQTDHVDAFSEMLADFGVEVTLNGQVLTCLVSKEGIDTQLEEGGFVTTGGVIVRALLASLNTPLPVANDPILLSGQRYKIHEIAIEPESAIVKYLATRR